MEENFSTVCENCGSDLFFNPKTGGLTCKYCGSNFILPSRKSSIIVRQYSTSFHPNMLNKNLNSYRCNACGRTYFMTTEGRSSRCPNCGNGECVLADDPGLCADGVIPFSITKQQASEAMQKYLSTNHKIPKELREMAKTQKLMSVLIPVWNFSFNLYGSYSATETILKKDIFDNYYPVYNPIYGEKSKRIKSLDECATDGEDREFLDLFDEKDYAKIVPYMPEYAFGSRVDPVSKDIHNFYSSVIEKSESDFETQIRRELLKRQNETTGIDVHCEARDVFFNFTYVPVYLNVFKSKNKTYKIYISGTTGKVIGKTPVSKWYKFRKFLRFVGLGALLVLIYKLCIK